MLWVHVYSYLGGFMMSDGFVLRGYGAWVARAALRGACGGLLLAIAGCGVTYTSPEVRYNDSNVGITRVELTPASAVVANRSVYVPRSLPAAFHSVAGSGNLRGAGALPGAPFLPEERAKRLDYRPLPDVAPAPYRIGVGDVLLLATRGSASTVEQLSGLLAAQNQRQGYTVRDDGAIAIPEVGTVELAGLTVEQAEDRLFQVLVENQIDPSFSLEVADFNSARVTVGGAVKQSVLVAIMLQPLTLSDALTQAGGITVKDEEFASIRIYRDGTLYQIPVETYRDKPELGRKVLANGDAIFVDTTYDLDRAIEFYKQKLDVISLRSTTRSAALQALDTEISLQRKALTDRRVIFEARTELDAEPRDYVYLAGEVNSQSRFALPYGRQATLADVLYSEGGFNTTTGDPAEIYVLRGTGGSVTAYHLNAQNAVNLIVATQLQMRPSDIVFIEEQPITKWNRSIQQVLPSLIAVGK